MNFLNHYSIYFQDRLGIINRFRKQISNLVMDDPESYRDIFEDEEDEKKWWGLFRQMGTWDGSVLFDIFSRITGIAVHVVPKDR